MTTHKKTARYLLSEELGKYRKRAKRHVKKLASQIKAAQKNNNKDLVERLQAYQKIDQQIIDLKIKRGMSTQDVVDMVADARNIQTRREMTEIMSDKRGTVRRETSTLKDLTAPDKSGNPTKLGKKEINAFFVLTSDMATGVPRNQRMDVIRKKINDLTGNNFVTDTEVINFVLNSDPGQELLSNDYIEGDSWYDTYMTIARFYAGMSFGEKMQREVERNIRNLTNQQWNKNHKLKNTRNLDIPKPKHRG